MADVMADVTSVDGKSTKLRPKKQRGKLEFVIPSAADLPPMDCQKDYFWLVVYLPLWKMWVRQLGWFFIPNWMASHNLHTLHRICRFEGWHAAGVRQRDTCEWHRMAAASRRLGGFLIFSCLENGLNMMMMMMTMMMMTIVSVEQRPGWGEHV